MVVEPVEPTKASTWKKIKKKKDGFIYRSYL
jgi:hypothetical protein